MDLTSEALVGPVDESGRLLHEDDPAAQLALAVTRLERSLDTHGLARLAGLRVLTTDRRVLQDVLDVLTERLDATGARPALKIEERPGLGVPGMLVALQPDLGQPDLGPPDLGPGHPAAHHPTHEGTTMTLTPTSPAATLRGLCGGGVHLPGDPGYDAARQPWNLTVDLRPAAVAVPHSPEEVAGVVRAAVDAGLRIAPLSTGHGAGPLADRDFSDVVLVRLAELTGVTIDPAARTARVLGGTQWQDVVATAAPYGLTALHGSAPDVAVAGYTLAGGMSFYGRRHGLAANSVRALEIVTADGTIVRVDHQHHPDLFWAVRGGGANLGVVVAIELELLPIPDVYAGMLLWDREHAPDVVRAWVRWTQTVPESVTTSLRVMSFPPLPELPPFLSGRQLVVVDGAVLEDDQRAAELLAPLRALAPEMDTFGRMPSSALLEVHMDPPAPTPGVAEHGMLGALPEEAVAAYLAQVGPGTTSPLLAAELRHLGGAFARPAADGGAISHVAGDYMLFCVAVAPTPEAEEAGREAGAALVRALAPWSLPSRVQGFTETRVEASSFFDGEDWARLCRLRDAHDPARVFIANHQL